MSRRLYPKTLAVLGTAALVAGCLLGDLDGLAGPPSDDGGTGDVRVDTGASDGAGADASQDALADVSPGASPCGVPHVLCADFDESAVDQGFTKTIETGPGSIGFGSLAYSPPHSLHATSPRKSDTNGWFQAVDKLFNSGWRRVVLQGDIYVMPITWQSGDVNISFANIILLSSSGNAGTVWFQAHNDAVGTIEDPGGSNTQAYPVGLTPFGQWVHVVIDFDPAGAVHYEIAGKSYDRSFPERVAGANPAIEIQLGIINYNHPVPAIDVHWDNVFVDFP